MTDVPAAREPQACSLINGEKLLLEDGYLKYHCVVFFNCSWSFLMKGKKNLRCEVDLTDVLCFAEFCMSRNTENDSGSHGFSFKHYGRYESKQISKIEPPPLLSLFKK